MDGKRVSSEVIRGTMAFFICYAAIAVVSILLVSLDNFGAETSVTSVFATLNNIGPGLSLEVGPFGSYASFSALSKVVLTLDMLLGRLELFPRAAAAQPRNMAEALKAKCRGEACLAPSAKRHKDGPFGAGHHCQRRAPRFVLARPQRGRGNLLRPVTFSPEVPCYPALYCEIATSLRSSQ